MRKFFITIILSSFFSLSLHAHGPTRQQVVESVVINAPVDKVWALVGDFSGLHKWHPAIQSTEMQGDDVRILVLAVDKKITEKLLKRDVAKMKLKYKITDMSVTETFDFAGSEVKRQVLPVNTYTGFLSVVADGGGSKVTWKGKFYRPYLLNPPTPEGMSDKDATGTISSVYRGGLDNLKAMLEESGEDAITSNAPPTAPVAPTPPVAPVSVVSSKSKTTTKTTTVNSDNTVTSTKTVTKTKTKVAFDPADSYSAHVKCKDGKKCKIDKFLLKGFRAFSQCQVCHGIDGNGSTIAPSLLDKMKKDVTYEVFVDRVTNGFKGQMGVMPPWGSNPNVMKKMNNLYAYLKARSDGVIPAGRLKKFKH